MSAQYPARVLAYLSFLAAIPIASAAEPTGSAIGKVIAQYNSLAVTPLPIPDASRLERIAQGKSLIVRERRSMDQANGQRLDRIRVVGYQIVAMPRLLVWLATLDAGAAHSKRLTEHLISVDGHGGSVWYQHLNTPWPVRDRHWVIRNRKGVDLTTRSDEMIWEHRWQLEKDGEQLAGNLLAAGQVYGLDRRTAEDAIYLSVNRGAWTMLAVDQDTTLVAAHTAAAMGGWIPDSWVARFVGKQLGAVLGNLESRTATIHESYTASYPVFSGGGVLITPDMAVRQRALYDQRREAVAP